MDLEASSHVLVRRVGRAGQGGRAAPWVHAAPAIHQVSLPPVELAIAVFGRHHHGPRDEPIRPIPGRCDGGSSAERVNATPGVEDPAAGRIRPNRHGAGDIKIRPVGNARLVEHHAAEHMQAAPAIQDDAAVWTQPGLIG